MSNVIFLQILDGLMSMVYSCIIHDNASMATLQFRELFSEFLNKLNELHSSLCSICHGSIFETFRCDAHQKG